jgi:transcriptional regulator with XRE-family HTH domain
MALAENIKAKRTEKNISMEELSGIVGVSKMTISRYESGKKIPELYNAIRLAKALGTTVEELAETQTTQTAPK